MTGTSTAAAQRLLAGIGFPIAADGSFGPSTRQAVTWFQEAWTHEPLTVDGAWGPRTEAAARACLANHGRVTAHLSLTEFACPHCRWPRAHRSLTVALEAYRARWFSRSGLPIVSGYRCPVHNKAIGGAARSQHLQGRAADVPPRGDGGRLVTVEMAAGLKLFGGLECQPKISGQGCTHVDTREGGNPAAPAVFVWG